MSQWMEGVIFLWHASSAIGWGLLLLGLGSLGRRLVSLFQFRARPLPALGLIDPAAAVWSMMLVSILGLMIALQFQTPSDPQTPAAPTLEFRLASSWTSLIGQAAVVVVWILVCTRRNAGLPWREWFGVGPKGSMFFIGLIATWLSLPLVLRFHKAVSELTAIEYSHPTLETMASQPSMLLVWLDAIRAVVVTPFIEEILYRGFLLGALFHLATRKHLLLLNDPRTTQTKPLPPLEHLVAAAPVLMFGQSGASEAADRWRSEEAKTATAATEPAAAPTKEPSTVTRLPFWPVLVTAFVFGANHWGQGAAPIALTFFAIILGELVRRTGSLWPAIVVHAGLNGYSILIRLLMG